MKVAEKIRTWAARVKRDGVTLWFACKHPRTPPLAKALCAIIVACALSPIATLGAMALHLAAYLST
jgi:uncharacterized membrane protein YkvA (DUF1232 family)